jgi:demethylmenaquinone methyltransferase/2-methoxy-6-polyprenyl-1,4-benzoquinol methylase
VLHGRLTEPRVQAEVERHFMRSLHQAAQSQMLTTMQAAESSVLDLIRAWAKMVERLLPLGLPTVAREEERADVIDLRSRVLIDRPVDVPSATDPRYRALARTYDAATEMFNALRAGAVDLLDLQPGQVVLDVGCGTGLCFERVQQRIGPTGWIIGVDPSAEMLELADARCTQEGWRNVTLIEAPADAVTLRRDVDAVLFCATHDVLQSQSAVGNVLRHLRRGGRCVAVGAKWAPPWLAALNVLTALAHQPYVGSFAGFDKPWAVLRQYIPDLEVTELNYGSGYAAVGRLSA